jgi:glycosyltransferase involved in cell wall biosynthesis
VRLRWTASPDAPAPGRWRANARLAGELAGATPPSDVVVATYTPTALPSLLAAARWRARACWLYADYPEMFAARPVERWLLRLLPRCFPLVVTYSRASADDATSAGARQVAVIGLGLPRAELFRPPPPDYQRPPVALYVGDGRPRKGLGDFLAGAALAYPQLPALRLVVATKDDSPVTSPVPTQRLVRPSDAELAVLYQTCGAFVSTSWYEGLGVPPLEAMACGAPVIVTDQRGARDYAVDGVNALVVPIQSPSAVAGALVRLFENPSLAARLSQAGPATAARYTWAAALDRFEAALTASAIGAP